MKVIALEEHFLMPPKHGTPAKKGPPPIHPGTMVGAPFLDAPDAAMDLDEKRLAAMDANGVTMQVLSLPFAQSFPAETAVAQCIEVNDYLAQAKASPGSLGRLCRHPHRRSGSLRGGIGAVREETGHGRLPDQQPRAERNASGMMREDISHGLKSTATNPSIDQQVIFQMIY